MKTDVSFYEDKNQEKFKKNRQITVENEKEFLCSHSRRCDAFDERT